MQHILSLIRELRNGEVIDIHHVSMRTVVCLEAARQLELMMRDTELLNFMETQARQEGFVGANHSVREHLEKAMKDYYAKSKDDFKSP